MHKVVDVRPKGMFDGTVPDPNPKLHSGHMLGSINIPFTEVIDSQSKTLKKTDSLKKGKATKELSSLVSRPFLYCQENLKQRNSIYLPGPSSSLLHIFCVQGKDVGTRLCKNTYVMHDSETVIKWI